MGWARANILYEKTSKLPEPGSPMEILFILVWKMRQSIEFQKSRALIQSLMAQKGAEEKAIQEVFTHLKQAYFPFDRSMKDVETQKWRERLMREIERGPLAVTALEDPMRKKNRSKLERGRRELAKRLSQEQSGELIQMDSIEKAKRRRRGAF